MTAPCRSRIRLFRSTSTCPTSVCGRLVPAGRIRFATARTSRAERTARRTRSTQPPDCRSVAISPRHLNSALSTGTCERHTCSSTTSACSASSSTNLMVEVRYVGSKGSKLLEATRVQPGLRSQFGRHARSHLRALQSGIRGGGQPERSAQRRRHGAGARRRTCVRVRQPEPGGMLDYNLANAAGAVIGFEARTPILGFNVPEAVLLEHRPLTLQLASAEPSEAHVERRAVQHGYTYSRSMDTSSSDPGSTAGGGKPDVPNTGFVVQGDQRNLDANYALSDFDRPHRFSGSFMWDLPAGLLMGSACRGSCSCSPGCRTRSSRPNRARPTRAVQRSRPRLGRAVPTGIRTSQLVRLSRRAAAGTATNRRGGFQQGRPLLADDDGRRLPGQLGFGNLGRNVLRGFWQRRVDLSLAKTFRSEGSRTSSSAGTCSTCSTRRTMRCRTM